MSEEEKHLVNNKAVGDWPPPPALPQSMYSDFLQCETRKIKQGGHELNRIDLLKRLRAEYPLPLKEAMKIVDEFCANHAPELQKQRKTGKYILAAMFLWLIIYLVALLKSNYYVCFLMVSFIVIVCVIKWVSVRDKM